MESQSGCRESGTNATRHAIIILYNNDIRSLLDSVYSSKGYSTPYVMASRKVAFAYAMPMLRRICSTVDYDAPTTYYNT